jgi:hypothetical protein
MNTPMISGPVTPSAMTQNTVRPTSETVSPPVDSPAAISPAPAAEISPADQSDVTPHADYSFSRESVQFPEAQEENQPTYAGLGEMIGGIAALFSGAPSASFSPVIEQAEKNLAERRSPQKKEPVEIDTAASDKQLQE